MLIRIKVPCNFRSNKNAFPNILIPVGALLIYCGRDETGYAAFLYQEKMFYFAWPNKLISTYFWDIVQ